MGDAVIRDLDDPFVQQQMKREIEPITKETIPMGYIPLELSTLGKLGVPKVVHCRNFSTSDLVDLSMFNNDSLPEHLISVINSLIYEKVDVAGWPDKTIVELLVRIYINYFTPVLKDISFPWNDEDMAWLEEKGQKDKMIELSEGKWRPKIDLDLTKVKITYLDEEVRQFITVRKRGVGGITALEAKFMSYPRYGDVITLRKAIESKFIDEEKKFGRIRQQYNMRERYLDEGKDITNIDPINDSDFLRWQMYEARKAKYATKAAEALYLVKYNDVDLSNASVEEKIRYIDSPLFDVNLSKAVEEHFTKLNFGLNPEIEIRNPVTGEVCKRQFTFRLLDILQALQLPNANEYDINYDD
jgi:hypothetical protein